MQGIRKESDAFGILELPIDALYGIQTERAVQNLSFSDKGLKKYSTYIQALAMVKKAAAIANHEAGVLDSKKVNSIVKACDQLINGKYHEHFPVDLLHGGGGIGTNMNMNEVIANLANLQHGNPPGSYFPVQPTNDVNASQSTSDVCHTAIRLSIISTYRLLDTILETILIDLDKKADHFMKITTISRTCLQDGMQIQMGEKFSGYAAVIRRRHAALKEAVMDLHKINLGGTVIGSGEGAPKEYREIILRILSEVIESNVLQRENLFDAAQNIDDLGNVSKELSLLAATFIKINKDLRLLSSGPEAGFSEITLPAVQAGSSFFPGKINPVIPETIIQSCFQVLACDRVVQAAIEHGELDLNVFEGAAGVNILDAMNMLEKSLTLFSAKCLKNLEVNEHKCEELANSLIPLVVELKGKYGYIAVSKMIKEVGREGLKQIYHNGGNENDTKCD